MSKNKEKNPARENGDGAGRTNHHGFKGENEMAGPAAPERSGGPAPAQAAAGTAPAPAAAAGQGDKTGQLQDRLLRLQADFDNFRKRTLREKNELFESANQDLILEILPVLDHLQLAIQAAITHQADQAFRDGLNLILDQLMGALTKFGLSPIKTEKQVFDPNRFEAVNTMPSATEPEGVVLNLVRSGYMLHNKLLRPAQVVVSSGPPPAAGQEKLKDKLPETAGEN